MLCVEQQPPELYEYLREMLRQDSGLRASVAVGRPLGMLLLVLALPLSRRPRALALPLTLAHSPNSHSFVCFFSTLRALTFTLASFSLGRI